MPRMGNIMGNISDVEIMQLNWVGDQKAVKVNRDPTG